MVASYIPFTPVLLLLVTIRFPFSFRNYLLTCIAGMAQSGKGLFMGVYGGVTGVFLKPVEGARKGGALGFAKGMGQGLVGLVARPAAGAFMPDLFFDVFL